MVVTHALYTIAGVRHWPFSGHLVRSLQLHVLVCTVPSVSLRIFLLWDDMIVLMLGVQL